MNDGKGDTTSVSKVGPASLRTIIPAGIARQLGIVDGSSLLWVLTVIDGEMKIVLEPVKADSSEKGGE